MSDKEASTPKNRLQWLDISKGIGICLVVIGHNKFINQNLREVYDWIFLFHMPLFFFITGVTAGHLPNLTEGARRVLRVAWQYLFFSFTLLPLTLLLRPEPGIENYALGILYGTGHSIPITPIWFLSSLATTLPVFYLLNWVITRYLKAYFETVTALFFSLLILVLGFYIISQAGGPYTRNYGWGNCKTNGCLWNTDVTLLAAGFLLLGTWFSKYIQTNLSKLKTSSLAWYSLFCISFMAAALSNGANLDINYRRALNADYAIPASIAGIFFIICSSMYLSKNPKAISKFFMICGRSSLIILVLHNSIQYRLVELISRPLQMNEAPTAILGLAMAIGIPIAINLIAVERSKLLSDTIYPRLNWLQKRRTI